MVWPWLVTEWPTISCNADAESGRSRSGWRSPLLGHERAWTCASPVEHTKQPSLESAKLSWKTFTQTMAYCKITGLCHICCTGNPHLSTHSQNPASTCISSSEMCYFCARCSFLCGEGSGHGEVQQGGPEAQQKPCTDTICALPTSTAPPGTQATDHMSQICANVPPCPPETRGKAGALGRVARFLQFSCQIGTVFGLNWG